MENKTDIARSVEIAGDKAAYDAEIKELLSYKPFLAWILKECAEEYKAYTIAEIEACIEHTEVAKVAVNDGEQRLVDEQNKPERIIGDSNEDKSIDEGLVTYDIKFSAKTKESTDDVELFINVEGQLKDRTLHYPLTKRMVYYLARLVSSQHGKVFTKSDYGRIKKVYSIWIVSEPEECNENTIARFSFSLEKLFNDPQYDERDYDLMTGVIVNLKTGDKDVKNQLLKLMNVLLDSETPVKVKEEIIEKDFGIPMTEKVRTEVNNMCNLSDGIYEKGIQQGSDKTKNEIIDRMIKRGMTDELITDTTGETKEYIEKRRKILKVNRFVDV